MRLKHASGWKEISWKMPATTLFRFMRKIIVTIAWLGCAASQASSALAQLGQPPPVMTVGWIEDVVITPGDLEIRAKLDTGARTSSINARHYELFEKNGERWVRFSVTNRLGVTRAFERRVFRIARIKRIKGKSQERPVIMLGICIGNIFRETQVNLVDRDGFNYQMLIGRRFLAKYVAVDSGRTLTTKPGCTAKAS